MRKLGLFFVLIVLFLASCNKQKNPDPVAETANVSIKFSNVVNGLPIVQGAMNYTTPAGNLYSVDLLKYYVSNVILIKEDGTQFKLNNYDLINAFDANFSTVEATSVPNGKYTSMQFSIGVDKNRNHSGAQDGDLDPQYNMIWTWSTGYIFFKHEGNFKNSSASSQPLTFHLGTDNAYSTVQIPISLTVEGVGKTMKVAFDLNKMYNSPEIDFDIDNHHMSDQATDNKWIAEMVANQNDAFSFTGVE